MVSAENTPPSIPANEVALIDRARRGDAAAFNTLVLRYQKPIYNIALRMMGSRAPAEDMTQEAFVKGYHKISRMKGDNFKAWMARVVTNHCLDELRRQKRRATTSIDAVMEENESPKFLQSDDALPEEKRQQQELARVIERCLETLSAEQRAVVVLRDMQGYAYDEIRIIIKATLGTVKSRLSRARAAMRDCLGNREQLPL